MAITAITFNGLNMNDGTNYITNVIDHTQPFQRNNPMYTLARAHGAVMTDDTYGVKTIPHTGKLYGISQSDVQTKIDLFNSTMTGFNKNLDIGFAGTTRRYIATATKARAWQDITASQWANFDIEYTVTQFGMDTSSTVLTSGSSTASSFVMPVSPGGSAPWQPLTTTMTLTAASGLASKTITLTTSTGTRLSVRRTWTVGDVLVIDETALLTNSGQPVKVNGSPVDFAGYFPNLAPGNGQTITVLSDFTTWTLTYSVAQTKRWM